jgi:two-component system, OmpR family, phosphate regulon response regulator PhoB
VARKLSIIEDDKRLVEVVMRYMGSRGYLAVHHPIPLAMDEIENFRPDLILLDWMLPATSGIDILKDIRRNRALAMVPVIMLTARNEELDKLEGLLSGADDYVTKPFSFAELEARIISVLRRATRLAPSYSDGYLEIVPLRKRVRVKGEARHLGQYEWAALELLLMADGAVSRDDLIRHVWGEMPPSSPRSIDNVIVKLRRAIEPEEYPTYIISDRGLGYRFARSGQRV